MIKRIREALAWNYHCLFHDVWGNGFRSTCHTCGREWDWT